MKVSSTNQNSYTKDALHGKVTHPNSLALLLVVVTSDDLVLLTETGSALRYYANHWACSIGEHIDRQRDFTNDDVMLNWVRNALDEELSVNVTEVEARNISIMAMIIECQIINYALVGVVTLKLESKSLDKRLEAHPRRDTEFADWEFVSWTDLAHELIHPKPNKLYHPSSGIRILYGLIYKYGLRGATDIILRLQDSR